MTALNKQALREAAQEEIMLRSVSDTSDAWQDEASPEAVLALLDELEAAESRNERALELLSSADSENVWEIIGRLKVVISGDYRSEAETAAAAGKGE